MGDPSGGLGATRTASAERPAAPGELEAHGITPQLCDFVRGLTIQTFKQFPDADLMATPHGGGFGAESSSAQPSDARHQSGERGGRGALDLTPWHERHAVLMLHEVEEMADFRYVLCPRRMTEHRFWQIYFTLVCSYEQRVVTKAQGAIPEHVMPQPKPSVEASVSTPAAAPTEAAQGVEEELSARAQQDVDGGAANDGTPRSTDQDIDAYLLGLGSGDEAADGNDDDDGFDADAFDHFVNSSSNDDDREGKSQSRRSPNGNKEWKENHMLQDKTPDTGMNKADNIDTPVLSEGTSSV
eukprot:SM000026S08837  [mRNA]  locus=s26:73306:75136:+ [translate_table: standard]